MIGVINAYELRIPSETLPTQIGIFRELLRGSGRLRHVQNELFRNSMDGVIQWYICIVMFENGSIFMKLEFQSGA